MPIHPSTGIENMKNSGFLNSSRNDIISVKYTGSLSILNLIDDAIDNPYIRNNVITKPTITEPDISVASENKPAAAAIWNSRTDCSDEIQFLPATGKSKVGRLHRQAAAIPRIRYKITDRRPFFLVDADNHASSPFRTKRTLSLSTSILLPH